MGPSNAISSWVLSALKHISSISQPPEAREKSVSQMREEIANSFSDVSVCNALFELGCLLSVARSDHVPCLAIVLLLLPQEQSKRVWCTVSFLLTRNLAFWIFAPAVLTPLAQGRLRALSLRLCGIWMRLQRLGALQAHLRLRRETLPAGGSSPGVST